MSASKDCIPMCVPSANKQAHMPRQFEQMLLLTQPEDTATQVPCLQSVTRVGWSHGALFHRREGSRQHCRVSQGSGCIIHLNIAASTWWFPFILVEQTTCFKWLQNEFLLRSPVSASFPTAERQFKTLPVRPSSHSDPTRQTARGLNTQP